MLFPSYQACEGLASRYNLDKLAVWVLGVRFGSHVGSQVWDQPEGDQPEGDQPEGDQPEGDQPEGDQPEGGQPEGDQPDDVLVGPEFSGVRL